MIDSRYLKMYQKLVDLLEDATAIAHMLREPTQGKTDAIYYVVKDIKQLAIEIRDTAKAEQEERERNFKPFGWDFSDDEKVRNMTIEEVMTAIKKVQENPQWAQDEEEESDPGEYDPEDPMLLAKQEQEAALIERYHQGTL